LLNSIKVSILNLQRSESDLSNPGLSQIKIKTN
jgi:hypothetical protein